MKKKSLSTTQFKITDKQACHFIRESNAIEEIHHTEELVLDYWKGKAKGISEIQDHVKAFRKIMKWSPTTKITTENIVSVHTTLMKHLLPKHFLGIRTELVRVGWRLCPYPSQIRPMLIQWCNKVNSFKNPTEEEVWQAHLAYEYIHPFIDGNGRSGRLVWLWLRYKHGFDFSCVENNTKYEKYYPEFDKFSWENWV